MIINISRLGKSGTGMWQYSTKFIKLMHELGAVSAVICVKSHAEYFHKSGINTILVPEWVSNTSKVSKLRPLLWLLYSFWLALKLFCAHRNTRIVSTTHHGLPMLKNQTITIHDLRPFWHPDSFMQKIYFRYMLRTKAQKVTDIITVSNAVRVLINKTYQISLDKISVVYNSVDANEFIKKDKKENFYLAVGASWEHKNIHTFLLNSELWAHKYKLTIVCGKTSYADYLNQIIAERGLESRVNIFHEVSFSTLKELYANAIALVYPSKDEGFGIPPIEAFASNTPVIVSDIPVFREVLKDYAIYVDPQNRASWMNALDELSKLPDGTNRFADCVNLYDMKNMKDMIKRWLSRSLK